MVDCFMVWTACGGCVQLCCQTISTAMSENNVKSNVPETESALEERCRGLMERVVRMRVRYPNHIKKNDKVIANMEAELLQRDMVLRVKPRKKTALDPSVEKLLEQPFDLSIPDAKSVDDLISEMENINKIIEQTHHDKIHKLFREGIDSKSILHKIQTQNK